MRRCIELAGYLLLLAAIEGAGGQYTTGANDGRWVVKCAIEGQSDVDWIQHLADSDGLDVWDHHVSQTAGAMVTAMGSLPVVQKLQSKLRCTERQSAKALEQRVQKIPNDPGAVVDFFANYRSYNEIEQKLRSYSNDQLDLSIEIAAHSHEGRNISVIRMQSKHAHPNKKIWIGCGQHAREWIAPASCMYLVDAIAKGAGTKNSPFDQILTEYQLLVAPLVNPDGYEYSRLKDRYWRKNRRNNGPREKAGVDLNRNWPNRWGPIGMTMVISMYIKALQTNSVTFATS
jgi:murein tripeptide amidase MpaA